MTKSPADPRRNYDLAALTEADAAEFQRRVPAASVAVVPSGHNVQEEIPQELGLRLRALVPAG